MTDEDKMSKTEKIAYSALIFYVVYLIFRPRSRG